MKDGGGVGGKVSEVSSCDSAMVDIVRNGLDPGRRVPSYISLTVMTVVLVALHSCCDSRIRAVALLHP